MSRIFHVLLCMKLIFDQSSNIQVISIFCYWLYQSMKVIDAVRWQYMCRWPQGSSREGNKGNWHPTLTQLLLISKRWNQGNVVRKKYMLSHLMRPMKIFLHQFHLQRSHVQRQVSSRHTPSSCYCLHPSSIYTKVCGSTTDISTITWNTEVRAHENPSAAHGHTTKPIWRTRENRLGGDFKTWYFRSNSFDYVVLFLKLIYAY